MKKTKIIFFLLLSCGFSQAQNTNFGSSNDVHQMMQDSLHGVIELEEVKIVEAKNVKECTIYLNEKLPKTYMTISGNGMSVLSKVVLGKNKNYSIKTVEFPLNPIKRKHVCVLNFQLVPLLFSCKDGKPYQNMIDDEDIINISENSDEKISIDFSAYKVNLTDVSEFFIGFKLLSSSTLEACKQELHKLRITLKKHKSLNGFYFYRGADRHQWDKFPNDRYGYPAMDYKVTYTQKK